MSMDRQIPARRRRFARVAWIAVAAAVTTGAWAFARAGAGTHAVSTPRASLTIATVEQGEFEDVIPLTAEVLPRRMVFLDARAGGTVEEVLVEDGDAVQVGQVLARLSNPTLQLDVISREAQITEQLNELRTSELALAQDRLSRERELVEIEHHLGEARRAVDRDGPLVEAGAVAVADLEEAKAQLAYYQQRMRVLGRARSLDRTMRERQAAQIRASSQLLEENLRTTRAHLDSLEVRAPAAGTLTAFGLQLGQSVRPGDRLGQIDVPGELKLAARIDQFYAARVHEGQRALATVDGARHELAVTKLYPQVEQGRFVADLEFTGAPPGGLRRGQTVQIRAYLGASTRAVLLPVGPFLQDCGGRWVFVISSDGRTARKRPVELGRQNAERVEVLDGLAPGEHVLTSSYSGLAEFDEIEID